jgi:hypothetical protein
MEFKELNQIEAYDKASAVIKELYTTEAGKKFVHHIIYAFTSGENNYVLASDKKVIDCLSKSKLRTVYNQENKLTDKFILEKIDEVKGVLDPKRQVEIMTQINDRVIELVGDTVIPRVAYTSPLTNKIIGQEELQALVDFIKSEVEAGNVTIIKMVKYSEYKRNPKAHKKNRKPKDQAKKPQLDENEQILSKLQQLKDKYK